METDIANLDAVAIAMRQAAALDFQELLADSDWQWELLRVCAVRLRQPLSLETRLQLEHLLEPVDPIPLQLRAIAAMQSTSGEEEEAVWQAWNAIEGNRNQQLFRLHLPDYTLPILRRSVMRDAGRRYYPVCDEFLLESMHDRWPHLRRAAVLLWSLKHPQESMQAWYGLLEDEDPIVRRVAAEAFARVGDRGALPALTRALRELPDRGKYCDDMGNSQEGSFKDSIILAYGRLGGNPSALFKYLRDGATERRYENACAAVIVMEEQRYTAALPLVEKILDAEGEYTGELIPAVIHALPVLGGTARVRDRLRQCQPNDLLRADCLQALMDAGCAVPADAEETAGAVDPDMALMARFKANPQDAALARALQERIYGVTDDLMRWRMVVTLARHPEQALLWPFLERLPNEIFWRSQLPDYLAYLNSVRARDFVVEMMEDRCNPGVAQSAINSLAAATGRQNFQTRERWRAWLDQYNDRLVPDYAEGIFVVDGGIGRDPAVGPMPLFLESPYKGVIAPPPPP